MFDHWDHTLQTGNDTEYALVVLALCVGAAYWFARFVLKPAAVRFVAKLFRSNGETICAIRRGCSSLLFDATSPPPLPLRV
jgi:hypothetical protein